ncbi:aminotransferase class III-fold pyridoxal phosphate-dependent enzyme [Alphaproteobacteria bacterium]|nr:aminotransferase class III-fold pyridoxal phosphate-dependent enzyme [Alphaproteobacteria bacterium]
MSDNAAAFDLWQKPQPSLDDVRKWARELFGLEGEFEKLHGERDLNYKISTEEHGSFVLKLSSLDEDLSAIAFQVEALDYIAHRDPELPIPQLLASLNHLPVETVELSSGDHCYLRVLTYLEGNLLEDSAPTKKLNRSIGRLMARLDKALSGFFHPAAGQSHPWVLMNASDLLPFAESIPDEVVKSQVRSILEKMRDETEEQLRALPHQVIHQDAHRGNLLVDQETSAEAAAIIDFGDMVYGPRIAELAVAADILQIDSDDLWQDVCDVVAGYDETLALSSDEIDILYDLILVRYAMTAAIAAELNRANPKENYLAKSEKSCWALIDFLLQLGPYEANRRLRKACNFPPPALEPAPDAATDHLLEQRFETLGKHLSLFYKEPLHFERASGAWLYGTDGKAYLDAYNNVPTVGHCHPRIVKAIQRQTEALNTNTRYLYHQVNDYAERLANTFAPELSTCLFTNSGSEANDIAWRMAKHLTGNRGALIMVDAYHGITDQISIFSPSGPTPLEDDSHVRHLRVPGIDSQDTTAFLAQVDEAVASLQEAGIGVAAFMIDSAMLSSGIPDVPKGYLAAVADKVRAAGGLVIADEVQAGFARSGIHLWGHVANDYVPDIVTMGKPVANGYPMGITVTRKELLKSFGDATRIFSTFGGNPVACAAASAVLDVIEDEGVLENCRTTGAHLKQKIQELGSKHEIIHAVRGHGLALGVDLRLDGQSAGAEADVVLNQMKDRGVLVSSEGPDGNILKVRPPLVFSTDNADQLVETLDLCLSEL